MGLTAHDLQSIDSVQAEGIDDITGDNAFERFQNRFLKAYVGTIWGHELHITEVRTGIYCEWMTVHSTLYGFSSTIHPFLDRVDLLCLFDVGVLLRSERSLPTYHVLYLLTIYASFFL